MCEIKFRDGRKDDRRSQGLLMATVLTGCLALAAWGRAEGPVVELVVGPSAPKLEQLAAAELAGQLRQLFRADVRITSQPTGHPNSILLGSPATNPAVRAAGLDAATPKSDQTHWLRAVPSKGKSVLLVGGNSPTATLWAAYELGHRFGLRSLLQGDFPPVEPRPFSLQGMDVVLEPSVQTRAWRLLDGGPTGGEAWGLADQQRLLKQLAKLKFNRVVLTLGPTQPFLHFTAGGVVKRTGELFSGRQFRVDGDTAGRKAFRGASQFGNPDLSSSSSYEERSRAGMGLVRGVIDFAHELGMQVAVQLAPLEFPPEFNAVLAEGGEMSKWEVAEAQLRACLATYPRIDALELTLPSDVATAERAKTTWKRLLDDATVTQRTANRPLEVHFSEAVSNLVPIQLSRDAAGILPQRTLAPLPGLVAEARKGNRAGWVVRARLPSDAELGTYYLARSATDSRVTPEQTTEELITTIAGPGIAERLLKGFQMVEQAAEILERQSPEFGTPDPRMVLRHAVPAEPPPMWWAQVRDLYTEAMNEMYRGNTRAREGGRGFILYYARRFEFGLTYMSSLEALRNSAVAKSKSDREAQQQQLEAAVEGMYNALGAFSEVARDPSDQGLIAVVNEFSYRPLLAELQAKEEK